MLKDGIYRVFFGGSDYTSMSIFLMKGGEVLGYSFQGSEYAGTYHLDTARNLVKFKIKALMSPGIKLVTGQVIGAEPTAVLLEGEAPIPNPTSRFSFEIGGRPVDVAVQYIRPLL